MSKIKRYQAGFSPIEIILVLVIVALVGIVGYMFYVNLNKTTAPVATPTTNKPQTTTQTTPAQPVDKTSETVAAINILINKGNYQGLTAYMSDSVDVVMQSTDFQGRGLSKTTASETVSDYFTKSSTSQGADLPWDFAGHPDFRAKVVNSNGVIKNYASQGHFAISQNNWVLAYNLNSDLKISSFYMSVNADII